jgi:hypothetical protein
MTRYRARYSTRSPPQQAAENLTKRDRAIRHGIGGIFLSER